MQTQRAQQLTVFIGDQQQQKIVGKNNTVHMKTKWFDYCVNYCCIKGIRFAYVRWFVRKDRRKKKVCQKQHQPHFNSKSREKNYVFFPVLGLPRNVRIHYIVIRTLWIVEINRRKKKLQRHRWFRLSFSSAPEEWKDEIEAIKWHKEISSLTRTTGTHRSDEGNGKRFWI